MSPGLGSLLSLVLPLSFYASLCGSRCACVCFLVLQYPAHLSSCLHSGFTRFPRNSYHLDERLPVPGSPHKLKPPACSRLRPSLELSLSFWLLLDRWFPLILLHCKYVHIKRLLGRLWLNSVSGSWHPHNIDTFIVQVQNRWELRSLGAKWKGLIC